MPTTPLGAGDSRIASAEPWGAQRIEARHAAAADTAEPIDIVNALASMNDDSDGLEEEGLSGALMTWLMPRPRNPDTLTQTRIVPLLGAAADMLAHSTRMAPEIAQLGARALEQELRTQRDIAERRATLFGGSVE